MYARVTRFQMPKNKIEVDIAATAGIAREVEATPGGIGVFYFVDRDAGETMAISLWDSERSMRESEALASRVTQQRMNATSAEVIDRRHWEVASWPAHLPSTGILHR